MNFEENASTPAIDALTHGAPLTGAGLIFTNIFVGILSILTIGGNALTITIFVRNASLRNNPQSNRHIVSLAVADLGVGLIPLPLLIIINTLDIWPFGHVLCMLKSIVEGTFLIVTIFTIAFISFDRYLLVHREYPVYLKSQKKRSVNLQIVFTWAFALVVMITNEILYFYQVGLDSTVDLFCNFHTNPNTFSTLLLLLFLLFIPMSAIAYFNASTFLNIRKRILKRRKVAVAQTTSIARIPSLSANHDETEASMYLGDRTNNGDYQTGVNCANFDEKHNENPNESHKTSENAHKDHTVNPVDENAKLAWQSDKNLPKYSHTKTRLNNKKEKRRSNDANFKRRYIRPAIMMGVILSTFLVCWAPLGVTGVLKNFKTVFEDDRHWKWIHLCMYMDSVFNPILYAITNTKVRIAMIKCLRRK